jgi:CheY-like chemotaxis protein
MVWVNKTVALIRSSDGAPNYFLGIIEDISAQKLFAQSLSDAKEQAESANRAKDQFLAVLSHELRTPLTPVLAITSALQDDTSLPEQFKGDMEMIRRNIEWEAHLIDDLLDLNAIAKRKIQFHSEVIDLHGLIDNVVRFCAAEMRTRKLQLRLQLDAASHFVNVDARRFQQVIRNLIQNAIKFTDPGGSIAISTSNVTDDRIRLEVTDTGMGMPADLIPRLFAPFEQGERTVTRKFGGLGLGLAISKALVEAHGGAITASSGGIGRGSTFAIDLQTAAKPSSQPDASASSSTATSAPSNNHRRILLVEDHPDTLKTMARLLKTCKYEVHTASTVAEAISQLQRGEFDLLISDLGLPDGSGYDVMRYVRDHHPMRAIALSGFGMPEDIKKSLEAGFFEHITKPINFDRLQKAINEAQ